MLWAGADRKSFRAWQELCARKRKTVLRWANAALLKCLEIWQEVLTLLALLLQKVQIVTEEGRGR
jgi:hypothetical protein